MNKKGQDPRTMTGFAMRGGLEEPTDAPNAIYWRRGAERAKAEIYGMFEGKNVDHRIKKILDRFYHEENTWMYIFNSTQHALDLFKVLSKQEKK
jgi:hypothetical protein